MSHLIALHVHFRPRIGNSQEYKDFLDERGIRYEEKQVLEGGFEQADILYMTRVQQERFQTQWNNER